MHRFRKLIVVLAAVAVSSLVRDDTSHAQSAPVLPGWTQLGQVLLDKNGCASCPATFVTSARHRSFGLATDSPFPVGLNGRIDVTCTDGTSYNVFLRSSTRGGMFQVVPSSCVNLDTKELKLTITSVSLSPADTDRTVGLFVYGRFG